MPSSRVAFAQVLALVVSLAVTTSVLADVTAHQQCQKAKILARGKWKSCRSGQRAKIVVGKTGDDNGDGTVSDLETGLMWEKKDSDDGVANYANPHDVDNLYGFDGTPCIRQDLFGPTVTCFDDYFADCHYQTSTVDRHPGAHLPATGTVVFNEYGTVFVTPGYPDRVRAVRGGEE